MTTDREEVNAARLLNGQEAYPEIKHVWTMRESHTDRTLDKHGLTNE